MEGYQTHQIRLQDFNSNYLLKTHKRWSSWWIRINYFIMLINNYIVNLMNQNYAISPKHISQSSQSSSMVKKQQAKTPFKMVPSVFEPPEDTEASYKYPN